jgi:hypothetical protein
MRRGCLNNDGESLLILNEYLVRDGESLLILSECLNNDGEIFLRLNGCLVRPVGGSPQAYPMSP